MLRCVILSTVTHFCVFEAQTVASEHVFSVPLLPQQPRTEWVLLWPGQVVIAGCQVFWTTEVSESLERGDLADRLYPQLQTQVWRKHYVFPPQVWRQAKHTQKKPLYVIVVLLTFIVNILQSLY